MFGWLKNEAFKRMATSAIRHGLTVLGGVLVAKGWTTEADATSMAMDLSPILVAVIWSLIEKASTAKKVQALDAALKATQKG